jgi:hypothetical protein
VSDGSAIYTLTHAQRIFNAGTPAPTRLERCPLPDCAGGPQSLAEENDTAWRLASDSTSLYWQLGGITVRTCALPSCAGGPTTMTGATAQFGYGPIVSDGTYLYFLGPASVGTFQSDYVRCPLPACATGAPFLAKHGVTGAVVDGPDVDMITAVGVGRGVVTKPK